MISVVWLYSSYLNIIEHECLALNQSLNQSSSPSDQRKGGQQYQQLANLLQLQLQVQQPQLPLPSGLEDSAPLPSSPQWQSAHSCPRGGCILYQSIVWLS